MPSGKGGKCPNCGKQKYQPAGAVRRCSSCGVTGFRGTLNLLENAPGGGRGTRCHLCEKDTAMKLAPLDQGGVLRHCFKCSSTFVAAE